MRIFKDVLKRNLKWIILWAIFVAVGFAVFSLYKIMMEPLIYATVVTFFILVIFIVVEFFTEKKHAKEREYVINAIDADWNKLPDIYSISDEDYQKMISKLGKRMEEIVEEFSSDRQEATDYYTAWVHQIKTPIAVMKLKLADDTEENRALSAELFRIEQYVDMVLQYIRLGSESNDLVIRECSIDELIRDEVRKFAPQFVEKKLKLDYTCTDSTLVTDKKWFSCILDQFLSNAIKYTTEGTISIFLEDDQLVIADTGIGIAAEDLPRIFEKGYTGNNGRIGEKSSGLGLYLAKKAADLLSIKLSVESEVGKGSRFIMKFSK